MDIKTRNVISDYIKEHIERVGLDEIIDELLETIEKQRGRAQFIDDQIKDSERYAIDTIKLQGIAMITSARLEGLIDAVAILTDKIALIDMNTHGFVLTEHSDKI